jgi:hypothetical protein
MKLTKGTPANMIQGTSAIVKRNVRWYNGNVDKGFAKRYWKSRRDG